MDEGVHRLPLYKEFKRNEFAEVTLKKKSHNQIASMIFNHIYKQVWHTADEISIIPEICLSFINSHLPCPKPSENFSDTLNFKMYKKFVSRTFEIP